MPLSDAACRAAKPGAKPLKIADAGGLYLFVAPTGGKLWRCDYRQNGKRRTASFGAYPVVSLVDARRKRDDLKRKIGDGIDPAREKKAAKVAATVAASITFESVAREWHKLQLASWTKTHASDVLHSLERDVFPTLGGEPLASITPRDVLACVRAIEARPAIETARRVRQRMSAVFVFGIATGRCETDPAAVVVPALAKLVKGKQPAVATIEEARDVMRAAESTPAHPVTKLALRILALTSVRPGEIRGARWSELDGIDTDKPVWQIPADRMKMRRPHLVPLSCQAVEAFAALRSLTGDGELMFPSARNARAPISENALGYLLNRAGYHHKHVPHGWRATFSTVMNERHPRDWKVIDVMLAHSKADAVEGAYNRALYLDRRRELAQEWADLLMDEQAPLANLIAGRRR